MQYDSKLKFVELPKICIRGPTPRIRLTSKILRIANLNKNFSVYDVIHTIYIDKQYSQTKMAKLFDVQIDTIRRWLKQLNIPIRKRIDVVTLALTKYRKIPFSGDNNEKAYILGLRYGDISTQKHGSSIRVSVSSTHPAMINLFRHVFYRYSKVGRYPKFDRTRKDYHWSTYSDLHKSSEFLINKENKLLEWILNNNTYFLSFLSGYFDAEGCISLYKNKKGSGIQFILKSCDKLILEDISNKLNCMGFRCSSPRLEKLANHLDNSDRIKNFSYNRDYWCIRCSNRQHVLHLLSCLILKHKEKLLKHKLALNLEKTGWTNANNKIVLLRNKIYGGVTQFKEKARIVFNS